MRCSYIFIFTRISYIIEHRKVHLKKVLLWSKHIQYTQKYMHTSTHVQTFSFLTHLYSVQSSVQVFLTFFHVSNGSIVLGPPVNIFIVHLFLQTDRHLYRMFHYESHGSSLNQYARKKERSSENMDIFQHTKYVSCALLYIILFHYIQEYIPVHYF